jgi:hypothetical protein
MDKYTSFTVIVENNTPKQLLRMRFIDSLQFLQAPLEQLVENLRASYKEDQKEEMWSAFKPMTDSLPYVLDTPRIPLSKEQREMALRKGIYPYEYMNDFNRLKVAQLPPSGSFYIETFRTRT